jgi:hypothetical protein
MGGRLRVVLALGMLAACSAKTGPEKALSDLEGIRDSMCGCKGKGDPTGCMRDQVAALGTWKTATASAAFTDDQKSRAISLRSEILKCCVSADWSGGDTCLHLP